MHRTGEGRVTTAEHELVLLAGMSHALEVMLDAVRAARRRVWIETYILRDDRLGTRLAEALLPLVRRGVDVRLLYDDLGSKNTPPAFIEALRAEGIRAQPYRKRRTVPAALFPRNHARIVLADDTAFTGGSAWGDEWLPEADGGEGWFDVCIGVRGPAVEDFARVFLGHWQERDVDAPPSVSTSRFAHPELAIVSDLAGGWASVLDEHVKRIDGADRRVWIHNAYYFAPRALRDAVARAAARGVSVKLIVPHRTDLLPVHWAARGEYRAWIDAGVSVFEYGATVTHAKYALVDDDWCTVGSFNMNATSVSCANELNVFVRAPAFVACVAEQFETDLAASLEIRKGTIAAWPLHARVGHALSAWVMRKIEILLERRWPHLLWADEPALPLPEHVEPAPPAADMTKV